MIEDFMKALKEKVGEHAVTKDNDWQYTVEMQGFLLMVHVLEDSRQLLLGTCVAELPAGNREKLYLTLLQGQYFFQSTAGGTLAVDTEEKFVTLQVVYPVSLLSAESFIHMTERFMQAAEYWRDICNTYAADNSVGMADRGQAADSGNDVLLNMLNGGIKI